MRMKTETVIWTTRYVSRNANTNTDMDRFAGRKQRTERFIAPSVCVRSVAIVLNRVTRACDLDDVALRESLKDKESAPYHHSILMGK